MTNSPIDLSVSEILALLSVAETADAAAVAETMNDVREGEAMLAAFETAMKKMRWVRAAVRANEEDQPIQGNAQPSPVTQLAHDPGVTGKLEYLGIEARRLFDEEKVPVGFLLLAVRAPDVGRVYVASTTNLEHETIVELVDIMKVQLDAGHWDIGQPIPAGVHRR